VCLALKMGEENIVLCIDLKVSLQIQDYGCKAGVVLNPATPTSEIEYVLDSASELVVVLNESAGGHS